MKLFRKTEILLPTRSGCLLLFGAVVALICILTTRLYPFLAQNYPQKQASVLIVEGWLADAEIKHVLKTVQSNQMIVATGGPVSMGREALGYNTYADLTASRLKLLGIPDERIISAPAPETLRDRTYVSALAARAKLEELGLFGQPINLYSTGAHARRSFQLYRYVFGKHYPIGVIAVEPEHYHLKYWYLYSEGFKHVLAEFISYIYAQFFLLTHHV